MSKTPHDPQQAEVQCSCMSQQTPGDPHLPEIHWSCFHGAASSRPPAGRGAVILPVLRAPQEALPRSLN
eukprot:7531540-Prorocentrum_lima.AAC.1